MLLFVLRDLTAVCRSVFLLLVFTSSLGLWQRSNGSSGMVQEIYEIRECQRPNSGVGSLLPCLPAYLKAAATGEGTLPVLLWVLECKVSAAVLFHVFWLFQAFKFSILEIPAYDLLQVLCLCSTLCTHLKC